MNKYLIISILGSFVVGLLVVIKNTFVVDFFITRGANITNVYMVVTGVSLAEWFVSVVFLIVCLISRKND